MHHSDHSAIQGLEANAARADALNAWLVANRIDPKATRDYVPQAGPVGRNVFKVAFVIVAAITIIGAVVGQVLAGNVAQIISGLGL